MTNLVSIVLPCYNAEKFIEETIQSVIQQTYTNWELLVISDGSTDNSIQLVRNLMQHEKRISLFEKKNSGVADTRNFGIGLCKGNFIAFLDADDTWKPTNIEEKINLLLQENIDFVYSDMELIDEQSNSLQTIISGTDKGELTNYLLWDKTVIPGPCSNIILNKNCLANGLRFDSKFSTAADQDFCFTLCKEYNGKRIPKALWNYRQIGNSMSRNISVMEKDHIAVYKKAAQKDYFQSFWFKQKCFSNLYLILAGSWWKNGNNKLRGFYFILLSIANYPPQIIKILKKIIQFG